MVNVSSGAVKGVGGSSGRGEATAASGSSSDGLPFTRLDLTLMLGGGGLLIASGVALSQFVTRRARI